MNRITYDFASPVKKISAVHGVGQPPMLGAYTGCFRYLTEAGIPYSRLHDVGGMFGGSVFVDIPNIFRNFDADETLPESYDFAFTDVLIKGLMDAGCEPYFRLGITIENYPYIKAYRLAPPADFAKWARICEHIIRHYNEGWADGFHFGITYWEIWNEPDSDGLFRDGVNYSQMWTGTPEEYYRLYDVSAKHLKACFGDSIKVGGYAACGFYGVARDPAHYGLPGPGLPGKMEDRFYHYTDFFEGFLDYVKEHGSPMDFCSWHSYWDVDMMEICADYWRSSLEKRGFTDVECHLNEWNNASKPADRGTSYAAAHAAAMLCGMQKKGVDVACYYDAKIGSSRYGGMFNPITYEPFCLYYVFKAFSDLYRLKTEVLSGTSAEKLYTLAAADGEKKAVLLTNIGETREIATDLPAEMKAYRIDREHHLTETELDPSCFVLEENVTLLLKNF